MSARARILAVVGVVAVAAAALVVGVAALSGDGGDERRAEEPQPRAGRPPLSLNLGLRTDAEAKDLRRAAQLLQRGRPADARRLFARSDSLEARVGTLVADWPGDSLDRLERLGALNPSSGMVQLNLGLARLWAARGDPAEAWRQVLARDADSPYAVTAGDLLHPEYARGLPVFVPSFPAPASVRRLPGPRQLDALKDGAQSSFATEQGRRWKLLYGVALQRLGHHRSAEAVYAQAARAAPNDPEALTAAAVGRFTKDDPARAFSRLGPLSRRFPQAATVRFHLGLLLLWTGQLDEAKRQLQLARAAQPGSSLAREAQRFLETLANAGGRG
jgi:tetratricopeptide (TPR) repeat protein